MSGPVLQLVTDTTNLYTAGSSGGVTLYYQSLSGSELGTSPDPSSLWDSDEGCWFTAPSATPLADPAAFASKLGDALGGAQSGARWFAWIADPNASRADLGTWLAGSGGNAHLVSILKGTNYQTTAPTKVPFGTVNLVIPGQATVVLDTQTWQIQFSDPPTSSSLQGPIPASTIDLGSISISLTGSHLGALGFASALTAGKFYTLFGTESVFDDTAAPGPEFLYTFGAQSAPTLLRYPFFQGAINDQGTTLHLAPRLDPLAPRDATRTNFSLDLTQYTGGPPTTDFFHTPVGNTVTLTPQSGAGFALGGRFTENQTNGDFVSYLVPGGNYMIGESSATPKIVQVMCGLWGTEFLLTAEGDFLEFSAGGSASATTWAPTVQQGHGSIGTDLCQPFDTAYVRLVPGDGTSPFTGDIKQSFCVLAVNSVYYDCGTGKEFPTAIGCRIQDLTDTASTKPFPMVPYGAVYAPDPADNVVDGDLDASTLQGFEADVLAAARRTTMRGDFTIGPVFFSMEDLNPLTGGTVRTGPGLTVELNDGTETPPHPGTWKRLTLAKSPVDAKHRPADAGWLEFDASDVTDPAAPKVVSPVLSNALLEGAPFLVVGKRGNEPMEHGRTPLGGFTRNKIQVGEFVFDIDVGDQPPAPNTTTPVGGAIMIFKYSKQSSVLDLYQQPASWTASESFVGDQDAVSALQQRIKDNFIASGLIDGPGNPSKADVPLFADFNDKMRSNDWTGMVVLDCPLDYAQLPIDIQVLLGGIKEGVLNAHHFGFTSNQLGTDDGPCAIDQSSLFGLVHHDEDLLEPDHDPDFQLLKLNALYANSALTHFDARIAVSVKELFGDLTKLQNTANTNDNPDWNTIEIDGVYQKRGTSGVVAFDTTTPRTFRYASDKLRALSELVTSDIALVPKRRTPEDPGPGDEVTISAAISLSGQLGFRDDITDGEDIDLFSYVGPKGSGGGLGFSLYDLDMKTVIPATTGGAGAPSPATTGPATADDERPHLTYPITMDVTAMTLEASGIQTRTGSLVGTYPLRLLGLRYDANGMTAASLGGKDVVIEAKDGELPAADPTFALDLKMIMGSPGSLQSDKTPLEGSLLVGWKPGGYDKDDPSTEYDDGFGVLFEPPAAMGVGDSLALEGVLNTVFGGMTLSKLASCDDGSGTPSEQFVLEVADVVFWILGLPFGAKDQTLTMFGDPKALGKGETELAWFMGVPGEASGSTELSTGFVFTPVLGFMNGLKVNTDLLDTMVIQKALTQLTTITTIGINQVIESICKGQEISETQVTYDPTAGILFFLDLNLTPLGVTIQALFADPTFYGGRIAFGGVPGKSGGDDPEEGSKLAAFLNPLTGLSIEFDYRKISNSLGVYSFDIQYSRTRKDDPDGGEKKVPVIELGEAEIVLPSVGVNIWTNGDWKVAVGWPFSSTKTFVAGQQLKVFLEAGPWPLEFQAGFYAANLHPQDVPAVFGDCPFGLIKMGGAGLSAGLGKELEFGPIEGLFELYATVTVQAMTASDISKGSSGDIDYFWFDITVGVTIHAEASINLAIISASVDLEAAVEVAFAVETSHKAHLLIEAGLKVDLAIKIIFFTIHVRFTVHITILDKAFGPSSWPTASTEGPTPKLVDGLCSGSETEPIALGMPGEAT